MDSEELSETVAGYLEYCRTNDERFQAASTAITAMTFLSPPEEQWRMILEAVKQARDDDDLGHIAAGPIEGLLGRHGCEYIDVVEGNAVADHKFARAMTGVWKYMMTDDVWARIQAVQAQVPDPLRPRSE